MNVLASAASRRARPVAGLPKAFQAPPLLTLYCHAPLVLSTDVTAMPLNAPGSGSLTWPKSRAVTAVPESDMRSSSVGARLFAPDRTGAVLTKETLMMTVPALLTGPPAPVLPRSLVPTVSVVLPEKPNVGSKRRPSSAASILATVPVKVMLASPDPVPIKNANPDAPFKVSTPFAAVSVSCTALAPASMSATETGFPFSAEKTSGLLLAMFWAGGRLEVGASLTAVTLTVIVLGVASRLTPPLAVPPLSRTWKVKLV